MNYEDKDLTTAIDLKKHKTVAKWESSCGEDGPHGLAVDQDAGYLFVACSTRAEVLDAGHNGEKLSSINTGDGVDDLNYSPATHMLYVGGAKDARLTVARVVRTLYIVSRIVQRIGLHRDTCIQILDESGFLRNRGYMYELRICIAEGRIGSALLDRFKEPRIAADNTKYQAAHPAHKGVFIWLGLAPCWPPRASGDGQVATEKGKPFRAHLEISGGWKHQAGQRPVHFHTFYSRPRYLSVFPSRCRVMQH